MASTSTLVNALNAIRAAATPTYQDRVPVATQDNLKNVGNPIVAYQDTMNEFLNALVNRIGLVLVHNKEMKNPLAVLKQGGEYPLGVDVEEIFTNPAVAETYNRKSTDLLSQTEPDVKAAYHRLNRQDRYTVSIAKSTISQAFTDFEKLDKLISSIVNSLYSGNYLDEFLLCKQTFASAIANNKIITQTVGAVTDETSAKNFITTARTIFNNFAFPSSSFNSYSKSGGTGNPVITWTPPEDVRFIIRSDIEAIVDVNVLANAFNMEKAEFLGQTLRVDNFDTADNCIAIMCDKAFPQIYDNMTDMTEFFNASNLVWNYYYHVWQTYSVSPFANAVAFITE